jgi:hypothetical protein
MITLNNSNIDFDLTSTNSILLSDTSNIVFRTKTLNRMIVMDSGNVGIGLGSPCVPLEVAGNIKASGRIVSTGEGFEGKGTFITEIPIEGVSSLRTTLVGLSGTTSDVILNVSDTSNRLVNRVLEEIRYGSNYTFRTSNELAARIDSTSNALINRIVMETLRSSNYTFASSNLLVNRVLEEVGYGSNYVVRMDGNMSNYVMTASNLLVRRVLDEVRFGSNYVVRMDGNMSNYMMTASNLLVDRIITEVGFGSNYLRRMDTNSSNLVLSTSNILVQRIVEQIGNITTVVSSLDSSSSGLITTTSNNLVNRVLLEVGFGSNYVRRLDGNMSNYVMTTSNLLVQRVVGEVGFGSNYVVRMDGNMSNYVMTASNLLVLRVVGEVGFGSNYVVRMDGNMSNYVMTASNLLVNRVLGEVGFGSNYVARMDGNMSNYVMTASNLLVNRVVLETGFGSNYLRRMDTNVSNYIITTSNILVQRVLDEDKFGSNYVMRMDGNMSNYVMTASNLLVSRVVLETGFGSNYARDRVGAWGSNYTDRVGGWGSNYAERLYAVAIVRSQWETTTNPVDIAKPTIFYNAGNVGIGTERPLHNLHIYSSNNTIVNRNASSKIIIQESNTSNVFSSNISDIISVPSVSPSVIEGTIDRYMVFTYTSDTTGMGQTQYDITLPENYSYDVLMVGGGGGGGGDFGGGGGGGAVLYGSNIIIPAGGYTLKVGNGGNGTGQNGYNTEGFNALCAGGGGAKNIAADTTGSAGIADGNAGGSGGGGKSSRTGVVGAGGAKSTSSSKGAILATSFLFGNVGGAGILNTGTFQSGGGGGAGAVGNIGTINNTTTGGAGGDGIQLNITGGALFWGAGGGGGANGTRAGNGGNGGGGAGTGSASGTVGGNAIAVASGMNAATGSGSGGGGGSASFQSNGGNGGSGIIVIRYRPLITLNGTPEMQFVIGNTIEAGASNYKIGNYNGNFQIKTSTSNIDRTSFIIQSSANVGVGTSVAVSKLHLFDNSSNAILTLQDNTSIPTLIQPVNISPNAVFPATSVTTLFSFGSYDKVISFGYSSDSLGLTGQTQYNFTASEDINVDILVVGGGGAGGCFGGGGGGGQVLLTVNYNIPAGTVVSMNVGRGGTGSSAVATNGQDGFASSITILGNTFVANGGGGGGSRNTGTVAGNNGGSGGGSSSGNNGPASLGGISNKTTYPNSWRSFGNSGGIGSYKPSVGSTENHYGGGGGGAGYIGGTGIYQTNVSGAGGIGVDMSSIFGTTVGASGLFGGGGGGMAFGVGTGGSGGLGGGGGGGTGASSTGVGGSGGSGGGGGGGSVTGGSGGAGVVIIRYRQKNREGNSEIQFIKGASIVSGNMNYKIGNYGGDFKVKSSIFNSDSDRFVVLSNGDTRFNNSSGMAVATIFNNGDLRTSGSQISDSDNRIKKDVEDIDVSDALRMILAVEPKTYRYIDDGRGEQRERGMGGEREQREQREHREQRVYGFIAQQVKDVIPYATETMKDILPNVMKRAVRDKNRVYLDLTGYGDLQLNEDRKINIRFKNGGGYSFTIVEVNKEYFVIDTEDKGIGEVFVYGYEVDDFHILTKDTIYTLNVSATQELYRKIETQDKKIKELEEKLERVCGV